MKKKLTYTLSLIASINLFNAQVAIEKNNISNSSVSLEFGTQFKGIILPWVTSENTVSSPSVGTLIFDSTDKKVKYFNGIWNDLSVDTNGTVDLSLQNSLIENTNAKVSIGTPTSTPGILVLENTTNQVMVLPRMDSPHLNIKNPEAGMIAYDTNKHLFCTYNGTNWSFWRAIVK